MLFWGESREGIAAATQSNDLRWQPIRISVRCRARRRPLFGAC